MATYRHDWELGTMTSTVTAMRAMATLQARPNEIFPFTVKGRAGEKTIKLGSTYDLINTTGPFNSFWSGSDPVTVSFTFTTLAGHHRGAGQLITFETYDKLATEDDGSTMRMHVYLAQYGTYISSFSHPFSSLFNIGANIGASGAWALQAPICGTLWGRWVNSKKQSFPAKGQYFRRGSIHSRKSCTLHRGCVPATGLAIEAPPPPCCALHEKIDRSYNIAGGAAVLGHGRRLPLAQTADEGGNIERTETVMV